MKSNMNKTAKKWKQVGIGLLALALVGALILKLKTEMTAKAGDVQVTFQTPAEAAAVLAAAASSSDETALEKILGVNTKAVLSTGDRDADKAAMDVFVTKYARMNRWVDMTDGSRVLYIGADNFAFPVPLAKNSSGQWYFDGIAGAEEVRTRNIGRNELLTIDACAALAAAQQMYFTNGVESGEYAQHIVSTSGKQDGLYWRDSKNQALSPLASLNEFPESSLASIPSGQPLVIDGYTMRILTAQGDGAPGGAMSYIVNGKMTGGFAVLATPVKYAETGIMTFMTGSDGAVYERDLGPDTAKIAASIQQFNPTDDWSEVE
ncbi:MAG: DUF2950 family protein [Terriglobales bacterium]